MLLGPYTGDPRIFVSCCLCGKQSVWITHDEDGNFFNTYCDNHKPEIEEACS